MKAPNELTLLKRITVKPNYRPQPNKQQTTKHRIGRNVFNKAENTKLFKVIVQIYTASVREAQR